MQQYPQLSLGHSAASNAKRPNPSTPCRPPTTTFGTISMTTLCVPA